MAARTTKVTYAQAAMTLGLLVACGCALLWATPAAANFGMHSPGVDPDADRCAMCHRVHSSSSNIGWEDALGTQHASALLVGSAATITEFCLTCHGDGLPGASTNVASGVFDSGLSNGEGSSPPAVSSANGVTDGGITVATAFETSSTFNAPLNAGGFFRTPDPYEWQTSSTISFVPVSSRHDLETGPVPLWAAGDALGTFDNMSCISCHEAHPTSNYRMLRSRLGTVTVGGYTGSDDESPNAYVVSTETGFPQPGADPSTDPGGFLKGAQGALQVLGYRPNYTDGTPLLSVVESAPERSVSVWCAGCHTGYRQRSVETTVWANFGIYEANPFTGAQVGLEPRHFHSVDQSLGVGAGPDRSLAMTLASDPYWLPLETPFTGATQFYEKYMGCLTCHRAHGTSVVMTGWAAAHLETNTAGLWMPVQDTTPGIPPAKAVSGGSPAVGSSALMRSNNREACERCHGG